MAIDRFQNKDILVSSKIPVDSVSLYSLQDLANLGGTPINIQPSDLSTYSKKEYHIYSANKLVHSSGYGSEPDMLQFEMNNGDEPVDINILVRPEHEIRNTNLDSGYYSIVYNFVRSLSPDLRVKTINSDATEIELEVKNPNLTLLSLKGLTDENVIKQNLCLNFGENNIVTVTDISFANNPRIGVKEEDIPHPSLTYGPDDAATIFVPSEEGEDNNFWIEFYQQRKPNSFGYPVYRATGRSAKCVVGVDENGSIQWEIQKDVSGNEIFYFDAVYANANNIPEDRIYNIPANSEIYHRTPNTSVGRRLSYLGPNHSTVRYYDTRFEASEVKTVVVKLYQPLPDGFAPKDCIIQRVERPSYIERVLLYNLDVPDEQANFSSPNFKLDLGTYGKSQGTDLKSWNDLLDTNLSTSQQIIDKYISGSFGTVPLNLDYTHFKSFVKYSSAVERVNNLKYKLELIESYDKRIGTLSSVSGSEAKTNITTTTKRKDKVISGFDGWERWMYEEVTGSLYTHYSSSNYAIEPWPKSSQYPNKLYSVTSSQAIKAYNGLIDSASIHDAMNDARLTKVVPASIVEDPLNKEYVLFVDMIGHHFDITWSYINALTSVNEREEHPYDGMPNALLYDVAKSMGWKLTHGKDTSNLWEFGLGTDKFGNVPNSGSLPSKSHEQINNEVWRRIVNNIPYLLKTKGSARAVKALIATYGIPQTFLSIREYGGPVIETDVRPYWEHDRFVYHLRMDNNNYIKVPWDKVTDIDPVTYEIKTPNPLDVIELQVAQNLNRDTAVIRKDNDFAVLFESVNPNDFDSITGNIHFYLSGSNGYKSASIMNVPVFDSKMSTLVIERDKSVNDITSNNGYKLQYRRNKKDRITVSRSASISIEGSTESSYNAAWTGSGDVEFGNAFGTISGAPSLWADTNTMSGSIQEIRYWANTLKDIVIDEHTLSRETYHGNSPTSSYFDLKFRFLPDSNLKTINNAGDSHLSQHPNQKVSTTQLGYPLTASLFNFENDDLIGVTEEYYTKVPSAGANNILNNKVRIEKNPLTGILDPEQRKEKSQYDSAPVDSNVVGVYLSATRMYNDDIINHTGYFDIDDYIGNPDNRAGYTEQNEELDYVRRQVFKKYSNKNLINNTIDILAKYDMSVFEQIRQTMPARVDYNSGILIEPHILERPKIKSLTKVTHTRPMYDVTIAALDRPVSASKHDYETEITNSYSFSAEKIGYEAEISTSKDIVSAEYTRYEDTINLRDMLIITSQKDDIEDLGNPQLRDMYAPSTYKYVIPVYKAGADVGYGLNWNTGSNGSWNYNPLATTVVNSKPSRYARITKTFFSSAISASLNLPNSSSLHPAQVGTDELPLAVENLRFLGCKAKSDSLTTNSPDTPDGKPVIEIFQADPNVLIKTTQTAAEGNLDVDTATGLGTLDIKDLVINDDLYWKRLQEYRRELREFRRKIEKMISIEDARADEFDVRYKKELKLRDSEMFRRKEFDIKNGSPF